MALINTGNKAYTILEGYYTDDNSLQGTIMPNIINISPQAIVPDGTTITFNKLTAPSPSFGADGDIWYNQPPDMLYKKANGVWSLLTDKAINVRYQAPVQNLTDCPIEGGGE